ncbi:hypothetical protein [Aequoribacter sp.]|uniref:hypothetical protein n=1 Tax=Aequoribacter sp. TaxID=2847771 RepID=UPI003F69B6AB
MPNKTYSLLACGLAATVLGITTALAQTDAPQTTDSASTQTEAPAASDVTTNPRPSQAEAAPKQAQPSPSTKTVLDYEASEQISEDFSVSFPIDI